VDARSHYWKKSGKRFREKGTSNFPEKNTGGKVVHITHALFAIPLAVKGRLLYASFAEKDFYLLKVSIYRLLKRRFLLKKSTPSTTTHKK
jgi:hypothetical protein